MNGSSKGRRKQHMYVHTCMYAYITSVWQMIQVQLTYSVQTGMQIPYRISDMNQLSFHKIHTRSIKVII